MIAPLTPDIPAFDVCIETWPLDVELPRPLLKDTLPPVYGPSAFPPDISTIPPTLLEVLPTAMIIFPAALPEDLPVLIRI